jgi:hypothetical protein
MAAKNKRALSLSKIQRLAYGFSCVLQKYEVVYNFNFTFFIDFIKKNFNKQYFLGLKLTLKN